jgi:hypothetical protein
MNISKTIGMLTKEADRLKEQRKCVLDAIVVLRRGYEEPAGSTRVGRGSEPGHMSAAGKRRIAVAQKKRWAAYRRNNGNH